MAAWAGRCSLRPQPPDSEGLRRPALRPGAGGGGRGLHAADILERRAALARAALEADPEGYISHRLTPRHTTAEERMDLAREARSESAGRAGVKAGVGENIRRAAEAWQRSVAASYEALAEGMGFAGVAEMLVAMAELDTPTLGRRLGVSTKRAAGLRARYGFSSPGRWPPGYVPTSPAHRPRVSAAELALIPAGVQPEREGSLLCRECGQWVRHLGRHLSHGHRMRMEAYQRAYGLDPCQQRAVLLGYADVDEMLVVTAHLNGPDFAALVGVDLRTARELRARHGYRTPRGRTPAVRASGAELAALADGVQPEGDRKLLCRECGGWYRSLSAHLANKHALEPASYRERYGLAIGARLEAEDVQHKRVANGKERWTSDPALQEACRPNRTTSAERLARTRKARRISSARPGGRAVREETGRRLARVLPERTREEFEERARQLSYSSVAELLAATAHLTAADLARLLGVAQHRARDLRSRHGYRSPGHAGRSSGAEALSGPPVPGHLTAADLAALAPGVQPRTEWWLACRDCGRWYLFLGKHVAAAHRVSPADYRARHQLPPDLPLHAQVRPNDLAGAP